MDDAAWWTGQTPRTASGREWQDSQSRQGRAELVLPGLALREMQGETACFAGTRPVREKKRRLRVLVVISAHPARCTLYSGPGMCQHLHGRQAPLAAKRRGYELGVPRPSWRIPVWEGSRKVPRANHGPCR